MTLNRIGGYEKGEHTSTVATVFDVRLGSDGKMKRKTYPSATSASIGAAKVMALEIG